MSELYMSLAAFVYYAKDKGFELKKHGEHTLTFNYSGGKYYYGKIMPGKGENDCGYVVINICDIRFLFGDNNEYNKGIMNTERPREKRQDGSLEHCCLPPDLWGKIEAELSPGKTINCLRE